MKKEYKPYHTYNELSDDLKEIAREMNPNDFLDYEYKVQGVEIAYCRK